MVRRNQHHALYIILFLLWASTNWSWLNKNCIFGLFQLKFSKWPEFMAKIAKLTAYVLEVLLFADFKLIKLKHEWVSYISRCICGCDTRRGTIYFCLSHLIGYKFPKIKKEVLYVVHGWMSFAPTVHWYVCEFLSWRIIQQYIDTFVSFFQGG